MAEKTQLLREDATKGATSDCVSREQAIRVVKNVCLKIMSECENHYDEELNDYVYADIHEIDSILKVNKAAMVALKGIPTVDAVPVRHGRWETVEDWDGDEHLLSVLRCEHEDTP